VRAIQIAGGGPAGAAAAITALREGVSVNLFERARVPRHKVCGEFIAPEACRVLETLGLLPKVLRLNPTRIRRCRLQFARGHKQWTLAEPALGLSRLALDRMMLEETVALGGQVFRGEIYQPRAGGERLVLAHGRPGGARKGGRFFGFKAHFSGPADDVVSLYLSSFGYVGISAVEAGSTNVCGLAREEALLRSGFDIDEFLARDPAVAERLRPLTRRMEWIKTGPLTFSRSVPALTGDDYLYPAGDALGFVDPFTGSGILNALLTGRLAGSASARQIPARDYLKDCARLLNRPFAISTAMRAVWLAGMSHLACLVPGQLLYRLTRPRIAGLADA